MTKHNTFLWLLTLSLPRPPFILILWLPPYSTKLIEIFVNNQKLVYLSSLKSFPCTNDQYSLHLSHVNICFENIYFYFFIMKKIRIGIIYVYEVIKYNYQMIDRFLKKNIWLVISNTLQIIIRFLSYGVYGWIKIIYPLFLYCWLHLCFRSFPLGGCTFSLFHFWPFFFLPLYPFIVPTPLAILSLLRQTLI